MIERDVIDAYKGQAIFGDQLVASNIYILGSPFESDIVSISKSMCWYEYEVKLTVGDFMADFRKQTKYKCGNDIHINKHNYYSGAFDAKYYRSKMPKPRQFYFVVPEDMIDVARVPDHCGLYEFRPPTDKLRWKFTQKKKAPILKRYTKISQNQLFNLAMKNQSAGRRSNQSTGRMAQDHKARSF